jgi:hypothetical protein
MNPERLDCFVKDLKDIDTLIYSDELLSSVIPVFGKTEEDGEASKLLGYHFIATRKLIKDLRIKKPNKFYLWHEIAFDFEKTGAPLHVFGPFGSVETTTDIDDKAKTVSFKGGKFTGKDKDGSTYEIKGKEIILKDKKEKTNNGSKTRQ